MKAKLKQVILEIIEVAWVDGRIVGVNNRHDWIDKVAGVTGIAEIAGVAGVAEIDGVVRVNDGFDWVNGIVEVANRINIYRVINLLWQNISVTKWQIAEIEFEIQYLKCWFQDY